MPVGIVLALITLLIVSVLYFFYSYRRHTLGENAPEQKIDVKVLDKQSITLSNNQPGEDNEEYWLYVQPCSGGPKREFRIGIHYYHALNRGDHGTLTYRGLNFIHFALKRS